MSENRVLFLDRDGTISAETGKYITRPEDLQILPGALEAIRLCTEAGLRVFLFTNQAGVGKEALTLETLHAIHAHLLAQIEAAGGKVQGVYVCPHHPNDGCTCRKPKAGLLLQAQEDHALDLSQSVVIGDSARDIAAGTSVGAMCLLVQTGHTTDFDPATFPPPHPTKVFPTLLEAARWLTELSSTASV